jgi:hypothetical protein
VCRLLSMTLPPSLCQQRKQNQLARFGKYYRMNWQNLSKSEADTLHASRGSPKAVCRRAAFMQNVPCQGPQGLWNTGPCC